jgi:hypothetical protein
MTPIPAALLVGRGTDRADPGTLLKRRDPDPGGAGGFARRPASPCFLI